MDLGNPLAELASADGKVPEATVEALQQAWREERRLRLTLETQLEAQRAELAELHADLQRQRDNCRRWETTAQHLAHLLPPELGISRNMTDDDEDGDQFFNLLDFAAAASPASMRRKSPSLSQHKS